MSMLSLEALRAWCARRGRPLDHVDDEELAQRVAALPAEARGDDDKTARWLQSAYLNPYAHVGA